MKYEVFTVVKIMVLIFWVMTICHFYPDDGRIASKEAWENTKQTPWYLSSEDESCKPLLFLFFHFIVTIII
jgi:hypothetical protein